MYSEGGLNGPEIAVKLSVPVRQVYRILVRNGIIRRTTVESNSLRFLKQKPSFSIKAKLANEDQFLLVAATMLYWAEGTKNAKRHVIEFSNSDPQMIKIYLHFLRKICGVCEEKLRVYLYCYANQSAIYLKKYWSRVLQIPLQQFTKPYIRKDFRKDKINKMPHGLVHLRYADKKLYIQIEKWHNEIINNFCAGDRAVNCTRL